ncbi:MAG: response regulator [Propionivibrio sp.]|nr:response regulator [Propionivibrio sp.]
MDVKPDTADAKTPDRADATILVVDDEPANLGVLNAVLQPHFRVRVARSGAEALRAVLGAPRPDLVLLDVMMPAMDGHEVLARLREDAATRDLPVIFVTAMDTMENEQQGLELGAVDYITKPINPAIVLARVRTQLELKAAHDRLSDQNARLEVLVTQRTEALNEALEKAEAAHAAVKKAYFGTLMAISALAELRGASIGEHSRRVADLSRQVAGALGMSDAEAQNVFVAALLHDIGKIGFPDALLMKPVNAMNAEQLSLYRQHPALAADALARIDSLAEIAEIIRHHHERYDGLGFPSGMSGFEIPLGARIIAAVSDYDDFISGAQTTAPMSKKESRRHLLEGRGHRYDPAVIERLQPLLDFDETDTIDEIRVNAGHLQEGMVLTRDVMHPDGFLLLSKGKVMTRRMIDELASAERSAGRRTEIYVLPQRVGH